MRKFTITVNGTSYEVTVEETTGTEENGSGEKKAEPVMPAKKSAAPAKGTPVVAPMPGTINKINCRVGDVVKRGDVLCVLEAMKMENDICAAIDGKIVAIAVSQGSAVGTDEVLMTIA